MLMISPSVLDLKTSFLRAQAAFKSPAINGRSSSSGKARIIARVCALFLAIAFVLAVGIPIPG
jgi:hypothetical protein